MRARNIHTVGQLAALTEADISSLPIREKPTKVDTATAALRAFAEQWRSRAPPPGLSAAAELLRHGKGLREYTHAHKHTYMRGHTYAHAQCSKLYK